MWSISESLMPASLMTSWNGFLVRSSRSLVRSWNLARVSCSSRWTGPSGVTDRYWSETLVLEEEESSFLACSACLAEALQGDLVLGQVDALDLELVQQVLHDALVPVVAAEVVVTGGGADLDGGEVVFVLADFQQGNVERSAAEVEDQDEFVFLALVQAVGQGGGGGLVDDAQDVQAGDFAGFLGGLALGVVEVRRNGDDGVGDLFAEVGLGVVLQLHEDTGGNFLRGVLLVVDRDASSRCPCGA